MDAHHDLLVTAQLNLALEQLLAELCLNPQVPSVQQPATPHLFLRQSLWPSLAIHAILAELLVLLHHRLPLLLQPSPRSWPRSYMILLAARRMS